MRDQNLLVQIVYDLRNSGKFAAKFCSMGWVSVGSLRVAPEWEVTIWFNLDINECAAPRYWLLE